MTGFGCEYRCKTMLGMKNRCCVNVNVYFEIFHAASMSMSTSDHIRISTYPKYDAQGMQKIKTYMLWFCCL